MSGSYTPASAPNKKPKYPPPFSLRLTDEERTELRRRAGSKSVGEYVRSVLFGADVSPRKSRRHPREIDKARASQLAGLGRSRLASNLNQIAKAANIGALPLTPALVAELHAACRDIRAMREGLLKDLQIRI
jgi:hypothetical protein